MIVVYERFDRRSGVREETSTGSISITHRHRVAVARQFDDENRRHHSECCEIPKLDSAVFAGSIHGTSKSNVYAMGDSVLLRDGRI